MSDLISRQDVIKLIMTEGLYCDTDTDKECSAEKIKALPSAELEPLTDPEQRIFLAAMGREMEVCKEFDEQYPYKEPYKDSLVRVCREIERKVKSVLWT